jgi:hypothetical protein
MFFEVEFDLRFNSFLMIFQQQAEEDQRESTLQIQIVLAAVENPRLSCVEMINQVLNSFEKMNCNTKDRRSDEVESQELRIMLIAADQINKSWKYIVYIKDQLIK